MKELTILFYRAPVTMAVIRNFRVTDSDDENDYFSYSNFSNNCEPQEEIRVVVAQEFFTDLDSVKTKVDVILGILIDKLLEQISEAGGLKKS